MMKKVILMLCIIATSKTLQAADQTLNGLDSIEVIVEEDEDIWQRGVGRQAIITDAELQLRMVGLIVPYAQGITVPYIYIQPNAFKRSDLDSYIWQVEISLRAFVYVPRTQAFCFASIWESTGQYGVCPGSDLDDVIRKSVRDQINQFLNAWLEANPPIRR